MICTQPARKSWYVAKIEEAHWGNWEGIGIAIKNGLQCRMYLVSLSKMAAGGIAASTRSWRNAIVKLP